MSELDRMHQLLYEYGQLDGFSSAASQRRHFAVGNFRHVLTIAIDALSDKEKTKTHTVADNYGAGDLGRMEPCMFCEDYEKLEEANSDMYEALESAIGMLNHIGCVNGNCTSGTLETFHQGEPQHEQCQWCCEVDSVISALAKAKGESK